MAKTNTGLIAYAKAQIGRPYWYGCYGQISSASVYNSKKKQYPDYYTANDFASQYGVKVHDCVGLVKGYLWSENAEAPASYNRSQDKSAQGMYNASTVKGAYKDFPYIPGTLVYKSSTTAANKIHHVGVYIGNGKVIEAKGHSWGVIESDFNSNWNFWSQCPYIEVDAKSEKDTSVKPTPQPQPSKKTVDQVAREVIDGKWGNGEDRKKKLTAAGYDYRVVQNRVNEMLKPKALKSNETIAMEVIAGAWGNGQERRKRLTEAGYDYSKVQKIVNILCRR